MGICIYAPDATDFSTNGLGVLTPTACTVSEESGGMFDLELTQPIDATMRWAQLQKGCIIKAPVPTRESPLYEEIEDIVEGTTVIRERQIYKVYKTSVGVYMRSGPGKSYKNYGYLKNGAEVVLLDVYNSNWYHVCVVKGGRVCYMSSKYLTFSRTDTEVISQAQVVGHRVVEYTQSQDQLFRIYSVERNTNKGVVTAKAMHVFYDLRANIVNEKYDPEGIAMDVALRDVFAKLMYTPDHTLHIAAGMTEKVTGSYGYKNPVEAMLDPDEGLLNQSKGLLVRDNFDVYVLPQTTRDSGVTIRRGKNLKGVVVTEDSADTVTRIIPCGKNKDGEDLFLAGTNYVDSPYIGDHPFPYVKKIDYDAKTVDKDADGETTFPSDNATRTRLKKLAEEDFSKNGVDLSTYGMKVDFVLLQNTEEYQNYAALQAVYLHDTVSVIDSLIGLQSKVRVSAYVWNCLTKHYNSITLGEISKLDQMVYSYNLPTAGISGSKIAPGSASGDILRNLTIQYAKISTAAVERLSAEAITALSAYIEQLTAETIKTNELSANLARVFQLIVNDVVADAITAGSITADSLMATLAKMVSVSAKMGEFDFATVQHLVASALNIQQAAVAGKVLIDNLSVAYAQIVNATIGNLVVQASDGYYYRMDVNDNGSVTAVRVTLTQGEQTSGQTNDGRIILGTDITAENLTTTNLLATYALVNRIDAARIDVDQLFANKAFLTKLYTTDISSNTSLQIVTRLANDAQAAASAAQEAADNVASESNDTIGKLLRWFEFDSEEGLTVQIRDEGGNPVGIWSTLTDEIGFHIRRIDQVEYVFSAYRDRCRMQNLEIGRIVIKPSSEGGHVWARA